MEEDDQVSGALKKILLELDDSRERDREILARIERIECMLDRVGRSRREKDADGRR